MIIEKEKNLKHWVVLVPILGIIITSVILTLIFIKEEKIIFEENLQQLMALNTESIKKSTKDKIINLKNIIEENNKLLYEKEKLELKNYIKIGINEISIIYYKNKHLPKEEILQIINKKLRTFRFFKNNSGYYFITKLDGTNISMPIYPKFEGSNLKDIKDLESRRTLLNFLDKLKKERKAFYEYNWLNIKNSSYDEKIGYAEVFEPLDILIGIAKYKKDITFEIKEQTKKLLRSFKNDTMKNYIFSLDFKGNIISHIKDTHIDKNMWEYSFDNRFIIKEIIKTAKVKGGGFISYLSIFEESTNTPENKISYVTTINKLDWVIGSGIYTPHVTNVISKQRKKLESRLKKTTVFIIISSIICTSFVVLLIFLISKKINAKFHEYKQSIENKNDELEIRIKERTKEQDTLLSLFDLGDYTLFKLDNTPELNASYVSKSVEKIFGYSQKDFLEDKILYKDCIHELDFEAIKDDFLTAVYCEKDYITLNPYRIRTKSNQIKWILHNCISIKDEEGRIVSFLGYIVDISDIKKSEKFISEKAKMAALGEMLGNIAHQWRQPLSSISTSASGIIVQKEYGLLNDEQMIEFCKDIVSTTKFLSQTIDDFQNFIHKETPLSNFNIKETIHKNLLLIKANINKYNIEIIENYDDDLNIENYEQDLMQILMNILNNAKDALINNNERDNRVIIISAYIENNLAIIKIKDNAGGICPEIYGKIFEAYYTSKGNEGTGLGLYMSKQLVNESLQGNIEVSNNSFTLKGEMNKGAQFKLEIPRSL